MIENYLNEAGEKLFSSFTEPGQKEWAWVLIDAIRRNFPGSDQWMVGKKSTRHSLRFGCRGPKNSRAPAVFFVLRRKYGTSYCSLATWIRNKPEFQAIEKAISPENYPSPDAINAWVSQVRKSLTADDMKKLSEANNRIPRHYNNTTANDAEENNDGDFPVTTNIILYGPPGTGKTYSTIDEALLILDGESRAKNKSRDQDKKRFDYLLKKQRVCFVTFHQSLSYEDFVEGLRAVTQKDGTLSYQVNPGVFLQLCYRAAADEDANYVLIIDEINRGNVARIFGELLTLIEPSKRSGADEELTVTLPYSGKPFSVPSNVHLIGTMNTADRSLAGLDIALRRRFTFKEMPPKPELLAGIKVEGIDLGELLTVMNERIEVLLGRDHLLGHAYFIPLKEEDENTISRLAQVFRQQIVPLLQEYFFEDWERIGWVLNDPAKNEGNRFVKQNSQRTLENLFGKNSANLQDRRWAINDTAFDKIESYRGILATQQA